MSYTVYMHTSPSGKVYVGVTKQLPEKRWQNGLGYRTQKRFYRAIQKYGWENFQHEIIATNLTCDEAGELEKRLICEYQSHDKRFGYNIELGGVEEKIVSETTRMKMSVAMKTEQGVARVKGTNQRRWASPEAHRKMSERFTGARNPMFGRKASAETRERKRKAMIGKPLPPVMYGEANPMYGKYHSEATKAKISASRKGANNPRSRKVRCVETGVVYCCIREASRMTGVRHDAISKVCNGKGKTSGGYHWEYVDLEVER